MKFIVAYDVRARANLSSLTKVFGEHRNLSDVEGSATQSGQTRPADLLHRHVR